MTWRPTTTWPYPTRLSSSHYLYIYIHISIYLPSIYLYLYLSIYLSIYLFFYRSISCFLPEGRRPRDLNQSGRAAVFSLDVYIYLFNYLSIYLSIDRFTYLYIYYRFPYFHLEANDHVTWTHQVEQQTVNIYTHICLSNCITIYLSIYLFNLSIFLSIYLSINQSIHPSIYPKSPGWGPWSGLKINPSLQAKATVSLFLHPNCWVSIHPSIHLSIDLLFICIYDLEANDHVTSTHQVEQQTFYIYTHIHLSNFISMFTYICLFINPSIYL